MKRQIKITKYDGNIVYGEPYEINESSSQMYRNYSKSSVQDFSELRKAMIRYSFTTKDFERWTTEDIGEGMSKRTKSNLVGIGTVLLLLMSFALAFVALATNSLLICNWLAHDVLRHQQGSERKD